MKFDELLLEPVQTNDHSIMQFLIETNLPVVLYGTSADVSDRIVRLLTDAGLVISCLAFDAEKSIAASVEAITSLNDLPTVAAEELDKLLPSYNVVVGTVKAYSMTEEIQKKLLHARSVSYLSEIFDMEAITFDFVKQNADRLRVLYDRFADERSRTSFVAYLMSKTRQDMRYLPAVFERTQYFPSDIFIPTTREAYFDCGAFTGDTIADFLKTVGYCYDRIWAAEPDVNNYKSLVVNCSGLKNIALYNAGIFDHKGEMNFSARGNMLSAIEEDALETIKVDTIDNITCDEPVTYIKLDVEGAELNALKGAAATIKNYAPALGVSIYHRQRDLIDIPAFIDSICTEYKFYFRVHKKLAIDTVLYFIKK
jgi:FkbM family methyltransferase